MQILAVGRDLVGNVRERQKLASVGEMGRFAPVVQQPQWPVKKTSLRERLKLALASPGLLPNRARQVSALKNMLLEYQI